LIRHNLAFTDYLAHPAVSKSLLDLFERAPKLAKAYLDGQYIRQETPAMRLGSLIHCAVLEPETLKERYAVAPECDRRTKEGKAVLEAFKEASQGRILVTPDNLDTAQRCADSVRAHPMAEAILAQGKSEVSVFAPLDGTDCKGRMDWLREDGIIADLKTTRDATPDGFGRSAATFDYPVQAGMYLDLVDQSGHLASDFVFIAVETSEPYLCATYSLTAEDIRRGRAIYRNRLAGYRACLEKNEFPGIGHDLITQLPLPSWWGYNVGVLPND
jgi:exodeoxyribonuclease VIII